MKVTEHEVFQKERGVGPQPDMALDPRQQRFIELYLSSDSKTFANCYKSAMEAGFSDQTARNLTHNKPKWYSEIVGKQQGAEPEHLLLMLTAVMNDPAETTHNKLKAIDMLMKAKGMYQTTYDSVQFSKINIQNVLD